MEMNIGANIKRLRAAKSITQEQLSVAMNVTCAAVSKWERGETYPDIMMLQPLAYYFGVTLDELVGYNQEKVKTEIDEIIARYKSYWKTDWKRAREIIVKAYHDFPSDYSIMHYYMWNIAGDMADNDPSILIARKEEFLDICEKILAGCTDEQIRINAWNMRAKILHAEKKTEKALEIYKTKFLSWYDTTGQKSEQLFEKNSPEYYYWVQKNMYELARLAGDKLARGVFFDSSLSMEEKTDKALKYGDLMINAFYQTKEVFFVIIADSFLGRMLNDLTHRDGSDEDIVRLMDIWLHSRCRLAESIKDSPVLRERYKPDLLIWSVNWHLNAKDKRNSELLQNPEYVKILEKYKRMAGNASPSQTR